MATAAQTGNKVNHFLASDYGDVVFGIFAVDFHISYGWNVERNVLAEGESPSGPPGNQPKCSFLY